MKEYVKPEAEIIKLTAEEAITLGEPDLDLSNNPFND